MTTTETLTVALGERSYPIRIGPGLIERAGAEIAPFLARPRVAVVTDETVAALHWGALREGLAAEGVAAEPVVVPAGEASKRMEVFEQVLSSLLDLRIARDDLVVAFGGGVIGDLAGFAAATLRRGVDFVQIPTTLLAQVDSSVGGKTGINAPHGKNLIGAFHQPKLVLADTDALRTMSESGDPIGSPDQEPDSAHPHDDSDLLVIEEDVDQYSLVTEPAMASTHRIDGGGEEDTPEAMSVDFQAMLAKMRGGV